ncbi:MAG: zinc-ribbon domain containing protein [Chloroflexi bacterium]|nr:zinc-ribbon domain containing protein [Chloroflexota bacterium]
MFADKTLTCRECGTEFTWTAGEQEFYQSRGLLNEPGRCPTCRSARRRSRLPRAEREYFDIICDECGSAAKVPFQPLQDRPVYCNDCFVKIRERQQQE